MVLTEANGEQKLVPLCVDDRGVVNALFTVPYGRNLAKYYSVLVFLKGRLSDYK